MRPLALLTSHNPVVLAGFILTRHRRIIDALTAMVHHPRSLARSHASWHPPALRLPAVGHAPQLRMSVTRQRVSRRVRLLWRAPGQDLTPAYVLSARITDPAGDSVDPVASEAWIRALVGEHNAPAVHEVSADHAAVYAWLTDTDLRPIASPAEWFVEFSNAA